MAFLLELSRRLMWSDPKVRRSLSLLAVLAVVMATLLPGGAASAKGLPKPHVSPALDAVLMPVTAEVRREFKLGKKAAGAVVVSVEPGGTADLYGFEPGDVITALDGKIIRRPVDIDSMVKFSLDRGGSYFFFDGTRKDRKKKAILEIVADDYAKPVSVDTLPRWRGYNAGGTKAKGKRGTGGRGGDGYFVTGGGGFFYADYCDAYYDEFYEIYDYTLVYVEEVIVTEVYVFAYENDEPVFYYDESEIGYDWPDEDYILEIDDVVYSEEWSEEYYQSEVVYDDEIIDPETGFTEEDAALAEADWAETDPGAETSDGTAYDESVADDGYVEEPAYEEPVTDEGYVEEPAYEEPVTDEGYVEEPAYEEPVTDEGYVEEPVYEEPAYEEPVYEEPVYEEPVYEEPAYEEPVYEEPVYEEPAYEEPVYEEPAYEEPVYEESYDSGGGDCGYDQDGNPLC